MSRVSLLLERDPYFTPGYMEHLWLAERDTDRAFTRKLLVYSHSYIDRLFTNKNLREEVLARWSQREKEALRELLQLSKQKSTSYVSQLKINAQLAALDTLFPIHNITWNEPETYLRKEATIDNLSDVLSELTNAPPYWWGIDRFRSQIAHHQHTTAIVLRYLHSHELEYTPVDGVHESVPSVFVNRFKTLHNTILNFAQQQQLALGRIAIVRLQAQQQSYRHYDTEDYLIGRNRYHLVLQAGPDNLLSSGTDDANAAPGEIWFFDNQVMHRAHNRSNTERIHVIFDGYPLPK